MKETARRIMAALAVAAYATGLIPAQEIMGAYEIGRARLDHYLERADNVHEGKEWVLLAEEGVAEAMRGWESRSIRLRETDAERYERQRKDAETVYEAEKARRYVEWLAGRHAEEEERNALAELRGRLKEKAAGVVLEGCSPEDAARMYEEWLSESGRIVDGYLAEYESEDACAYAELMGRAEEAGAAWEEMARGRVESARERIRSEAGMLSRKEGSMLVARFLEDRDSLKAAKAMDAASVIMKGLSAEAEKETAEEMEELFASLKRNIEGRSAEGEGTEKLLAQFEEVFTRGIAKWEESEAEFLADRKEWEQAAGCTYEKGLSAWEKAAEELKARRREWECEIQKNIEELTRLAAERNAEFENEAQGALESYAQKLEESRRTQAEMVRTNEQIYVTLRGALSAVSQGIRSWASLWGERYKGVYSYWKTEDMLKRLADGTQDIDAFEAENELKDIKDSIENYLKKEQQMLLDTYDKALCSMEEQLHESMGILNGLAEKTTYMRRDGEEKDVFTDEGCVHDEAETYSGMLAGLDRYCRDTEGNLDEEMYETERAKFEKALAEYDEARSERQRLVQYADIGEQLEILTERELCGYEDGNKDAFIAHAEYVGKVRANTVLSRYGTFTSDIESKTAFASLVDWYARLAEYSGQIREVMGKLHGMGEESAGRYTELDMEIAKAEMQKERAREEHEIASAVDSYARCENAGRESREETETRLAEAEERYGAAYEEYLSLSKGAEGYSAAVRKAQAELSAAYDELMLRESELSGLKGEYEAMANVSDKVDAGMIRTMLGKYLDTFERTMDSLKRAEKDAVHECAVEDERQEYLAAKGAEKAYVQEFRKNIVLMQETRLGMESCDEGKLEAYMREKLQGVYAAEEFGEVLSMAVGYAAKADGLVGDASLSDSYKEFYWKNYLDQIKSVLEYITYMNENLISGLQNEEMRGKPQEGPQAKTGMICQVLAIDAEENRKILEEIYGYQEADEAGKKALRTQWESESRADAMAVIEGEYEFKTDRQKDAFIFLERLGKEREYLAEKYESLEEHHRDVGNERNAGNIIGRYEAAKEKAKRIIEENNDTAQATAAGYGMVIEYIVSLMECRDGLSASATGAMEKYVEAYLSREAFRYMCLAEGSAVVAEQRHKELTAVIEGYGARNVSGEGNEQPEREMTRSRVEQAFLSHVLGEHAADRTGWARKLLALGFEDKNEKLLGSVEETMLGVLSNSADEASRFFREERAWDHMEDYMEGAETEGKDLHAGQERQMRLDEARIAAERLTETLKTYTAMLEMKSGSGDTKIRQQLERIAEATASLSEANRRYAEKLEGLAAAGEEYARHAEEVNRKYESLECLRLEKRKAQAVYDWASSVYLGNFGESRNEAYVTPKEMLTEAGYALRRAEASLAILKGLAVEYGGGKDRYESEEMESFAAAEKEYYDSLVLRYELVQAYERAKNALMQAESARENARDAVVREKGYGCENRLVKIMDDGTGNITYRLTPLAEGNSQAQQAWYDGRTEKAGNVILPESYRSKASVETERFILRMSEDGEYMNSVALAAYYLMAESRMNYDSYMDPYGDGWETVGGMDGHGISYGETYKECRRHVLRNAYASVMARGGEQDIAMYLLVRDGNNVIADQVRNRYEETILKTYSCYMLYMKMEEYVKAETWATKLSGNVLSAKSRFAGELARLAMTEAFLAYQKQGSYGEAVQAAVGRYREASAGQLRALRQYNNICYGSDGAAEGKVGMQRIAETIRKVALGNGSKLTEDEVAGLVLCMNEEGYADIIEACEDICMRKEMAHTAAKEECARKAGEERARLLESAAEYERQVGAGQRIAQATRTELRKLALRASDMTLPLKERRAASEEYDRLYEEALQGTAGEEADLSGLASGIFSGDAFNSLKYYGALYGIYGAYLEWDNVKARIDLGRDMEGYYSDFLGRYNEFLMEGSAYESSMKIGAYRLSLENSLELACRENAEAIEILKQTAVSGKGEWDRAEEKLNMQYHAWQRSFLRRYEAEDRNWQENYAVFLEGKQEWIYRIYEDAASETGAGAGSTEEEIRCAKLRARRGAWETMPEADPSAIVEELLGGTGLQQTAARLESVRGRMASNRLVVRTEAEPADRTGILYEARAVMARALSRMEESASKLSAQTAAENLEAMRKSYEGSVQDANRNVEESVKDIAQSKGYMWTRSVMARRIVADSTMMRTSYKNQVVNGYEWFDTAGPKLSIGFGEMARLTGQALAYAMQVSRDELDMWYEDVFGNGITASGTTKIGYTYGGRFGRHLGRGGSIKPDADVTKGMMANIQDMGEGALSIMMLSFEWNDLEQRHGLAELAKPAWDQKMWSGTAGCGIEPPTVRTVVTTAVSVVGSVMSAVGTAVAGPVGIVLGPAMSAAMSFKTDMAFAVLDYVGGYKQLDQVGKEIGVSAATNAIGAIAGIAGNAVGGAGGVVSNATSNALKGMGGTLLKAGISTTSTVLTKGSTALINSGGNLNEVRKEFNSFSDWAGIAGSAVTSIITGSANLSGGSEKILEGGLGFMASVTGKATEYGMHLAGSYIDGKGYKDAFDRMGGLTLNIASLGTIADIVGSAIRRGNEDGQAKEIFSSEKLKGTGFLELNIGRNGVSTKLGTGGIDLGNLYMFGKRMLDMSKLTNQAIKAKSIEKAASPEDIIDAHKEVEKTELGRLIYLYGDSVQEDAAIRLANGKDDLELVEKLTNEKGESANGKTEQKADGTGRIIKIVDSKDMLNNAIILGHESYRDGRQGSETEQQEETRRAVEAHTRLASNLIGSDKNLAARLLAANPLLAKEVAALRSGNLSRLERIADERYDSSSDYWKVMKDKNGNILGIEDDQSNDITFVDENGKQIGDTVKYVSGSRSEFIANTLGITQDGVLDMLIAAGYSYNSNSGLFDRSENGKKTFDLNGNAVDAIPLPTNNGEFFDFVKAGWNKFTDLKNNVVDKISTLFQSSSDKKIKEKVEKENQTYMDEISKYKNIKEKKGWGDKESHCDEYVEEIVNGMNKLPKNWPASTGMKVSYNDDSKESYMTLFMNQMKDDPQSGWNIMMMDGTTYSGEVKAPHMVLIYQRSDGLVNFTHYTSDHVVDPEPRMGWTINQLTKTGKGGNDRLGYSRFKYLPLGN